VILIDLLGFGGSLDEIRSDFSLEAHVKALDEAFDALGLESSRLILAAHSMGAALALTWATRHAHRVARVVLWGAPVYDTESDARNSGADYGGFARLFLLDTTWAESTCHVSCRHRTASGRAMALIAPRWPIPVSTSASRHTWDSYQQSLNELVLKFDWAAVLPGAVGVTIFRGTNDPIGDRAYIANLVERSDLIDVTGGDHHIALTNPELLCDLLEASA
jgi:pimeloyl-ACP methyl ester carboxylesterase